MVVKIDLGTAYIKVIGISYTILWEEKGSVWNGDQGCLDVSIAHFLIILNDNPKYFSRQLGR